MTSKQPAASALLSTVNDAHLLVEVHLSPNSFGGKLPPGATLRLAARVASGKVQFPSAVVSLLDASNQPTSLSSLFGFLSMDALHLWQPSEDCATFDVIARGRLLFIPLWKHIVTQIPVEIERIPSWVAQILSASARDIPSKAHATAAPDRNHFRRVRLDVTFDLLPGSKLPVNEATILTLAEDGRATVSVSGVGDYSVATVTGTNVSITFPRLTTSSSDVDVRVVLNRAESGVHLFALDETTLRNVGLKPAAGFSRPVLDEVNVRASKAGGGRKAYDFVVAIDPHSDFTVEGLIGEVTRRVGDPKVIAALKRTLLEKVDDGHSGEAPSVCTIDSSRWRMLDFITHDGRMHLEDAFDLPEIRLGMDDPAIDAVVKRLVPDLRLFATATQLQAVSEYDTDELVDAVKLLLTPNVRAVFDVIDPSVVPALLSALALPSLSINPTQVETASHRLHSSDTPHTPTIAPVLVRAGKSLNTHQRPRLRSAWASAGGLERNGRPYVLLASLVDALRASVSADPSSPDSLRELLSQVHTGPGLNLKLLVASDSIRAVAWASETVFPHGWGAVSEQLEGDVRRLYGRPDAHGGCAARVGTSAFCAQAARANDDAEGFFDAGVRFVGDGEEFLQQVAKLLDATSARAIGSEGKGTVVLNYSSFEAVYASDTQKGDACGVRIAERLKQMAMDGFAVSVVVDEGNGPRRRGQKGLSKIAKEVVEDGKGTFVVHAWMPPKQRFPLGTHVKYLVTPIGVVGGGSNLGDHCAARSDTNVLLRGREVVERFASHHAAVLSEWRPVGHDIPPVPPVVAGEPEAWAPLETYDLRGEEEEVFQKDWAAWEAAGVRVFRDLGVDPRDRILGEHIAVLDVARKGTTVYIANGCVVFPHPVDENPLARAIFRSLEHGVNVELITNAVGSIDGQFVGGPVVKTVFLLLKRASATGRATEDGGGVAGTFTVHLPSSDLIIEHADGHVRIHDSLLFTQNLALVSTHSFHPRSISMQQEFLMEILGDAQPPGREAHERFLALASRRFERLLQRPGGDRIEDMDELMGPLRWRGNSPPDLFGPAGLAYVLFQEKKWLWCQSYSSGMDGDIREAGGMVDGAAEAGLVDLIVNAF